MFRKKVKEIFNIKGDPMRVRCVWKDEDIDLIVDKVYNVLDCDYENGLMRIRGEEGIEYWYREKYLEIVSY